MKIDTAIKIAVASIEKERRTYYAFDANLYKQGVKSIATERAYKNYTRLSEAIKALENAGHQGLLV